MFYDPLDGGVVFSNTSVGICKTKQPRPKKSRPSLLVFVPGWQHFPLNCIPGWGPRKLRTEKRAFNLYTCALSGLAIRNFRLLYKFN